MDSGVGQQVRVAAEYPRVRGKIVAVERLPPIVRRADLAPERRIRFLGRMGSTRRIRATSSGPFQFGLLLWHC